MAYNGSEETRFIAALHTLNGFYLSDLEKLLVKNQTGRYFKVSPEFPRLSSTAKLINYTETQEDKDFIEKIKNILQDAEFIVGETPNVTRNKLTKAQESGFVCAETLQEFSSVMKQRMETVACFDACKTAFLENMHHEVSTDLQLMLLEVTLEGETEKSENKKSIMEEYKIYSDSDKKFMKTYKEFITSCETLFQMENTTSNLCYLSKKAFDKAVMLEYKKSPMEICESQGNLWRKVIGKLAGLTGTTVPKEDDESNSRRRDDSKYERKKRLLLNTIDRIMNKDFPETLTEESCRIHITEISRKKSSIEDHMCEDPNTTDEDLEEMCRSADECIIALTERLQKLKENQELSRMEKQQNAKALPSIKLMKLKGGENYLDWLENQRVLNTHVDSYKRAAVLKETVTDQELIKRLDGLADIDEIMSIIQSKYARFSMLIPAMLNDLKNTPNARTTEECLTLIGKIRNIFSKIKRLGSGALSRIDGSVIQDMIGKFPHTFQESYENYILDHEGDEIDDSASSIHDNTEYFDVIKDMTTLEVNQESERMRKMFMKFLRRQESVQLNINVRSGPAKQRYERNKNEKVKFQKVKTFSTIAKENSAKDTSKDVSNCPMHGCNKKHTNKKGYITDALSACPSFRELDAHKRRKIIAQKSHCVMCLKPNCTPQSCRIKGTCFNCPERHHVLLCLKENKGKL